MQSEINEEETTDYGFADDDASVSFIALLCNESSASL